MTDHQHRENWTAAGMAGMFDAVHRDRDRKKHRRVLILWLTTITICLGVPLTITWKKFQDARISTFLEEFTASRQQAEQLSGSNPAVAEAVNKADELRSSLANLDSAESIAVLREALDYLERAEDVDRDTIRVRNLLDPIGKTLIDEHWFHSSKAIEQKHMSLSKEHKAVVALLAIGQIEEAEKRLANLLVDVGNLQRENVEAMKASLARQAWERIRTAVPDRVKKHAIWKSVMEIGDDAELAWDEATDWIQAKTLYARATERANEFLDAELSPAEKSEFLPSDSDAVARIESEKADLKREIQRLTDAEMELNKSLAAVISDRKMALDEVQKLTGKLNKLMAQSQLQSSELAELRPLKAQLDTANDEIRSVRTKLIASLTEKSQLNATLEQTRRQLAARMAELRILNESSKSGSTESTTLRVAAALATIESQLAEEVNTGDSQAIRKAAQEALLEILGQYDVAVDARDQAKAEFFLESSQRMKDCNRAIMQVERSLARGLSTLDAPQALEYERLEMIVMQLKSEYSQLLTEVDPQNIVAKKLDARITDLESRRERFLSSYERQQGSVLPKGEALVVICRQEIQELLERRQKEKIEGLVGDGEVPKVPGQSFVPISAGMFRMGSNGASDEQPVHLVQFSKPFFAGQHPVTIGQTLAWLNSPGLVIEKGWINFDSQFCPIKRNGNRCGLNHRTKFGDSVQKPMIEISWYGAKAYCEWASQQDPRFRVRLPTEAEWEYICRAGSTTKYPWGDRIDSNDANFGSHIGSTTEVGKYPANAWGLEDTLGNVWEWCEDVYDPEFYGSSAGNRENPVNLAGSPRSSRVVRGGAWNNRDLVRSGNRYYRQPGDQNHYIGFRVVAD